MAERSKALRSGRSLVLQAWVRIPLLTNFFQHAAFSHKTYGVTFYTANLNKHKCRILLAARNVIFLIYLDVHRNLLTGSRGRVVKAID